MDSKSSRNPLINDFSRRDFIKKSSAAMGAGLVLGSLPIGLSAYAAGNETLKIGVIGCGGRGTGAVNQALIADKDVKLVAMADAFRDRIDTCYETLMQRYGDSDRLDVPEEHKFTGFDGYKSVIELSDVIILTTPPGFRPLHFEEAVAKGKHVFMEKPVATDIDGVKRVLEAGKLAKQKNLNVVVGLQRHYQTSYTEALQRVQNGDIGEIVGGSVYWNSGGVWVVDREPSMSELEYQMRNWYYFNWLCGDHILEQHIHNIDVANWFIGEYPIKAQGMGGREVRTGKRYGEIYDHHFVEFTYPSGSVISSQCRHQRDTYSIVAETLRGTKGSVELDSGNKAILRDRTGKELYNHDGKNDINPYQQEHYDLFSSIRNGDLISDTENGAMSTLSAIMGRMATYSGQVITTEMALDSGEKLVPDSLDWDAEPPVQPGEDGEYAIPKPGTYTI